jgi:4-hydroxy-2-oxoheptanedioate aldolase
MRPSRIRQKLKANQPVMVPLLNLGDPAIFELTSLMGFDGIWLDLEHHAHTLETATNLMRAARVGKSDIIARPAKGEFMRMGRLLEAGAQGIMYPRCDNAAEAKEVVKWAKFPPLGRRGIDGGNPDMPYCSMPVAKYLKEANEQTFIIVQIEDPQALEHVEEIAAVDGVDIVMLGPGDFSSLGGIIGQISDSGLAETVSLDHPKLADAIARVSAAAKRAGKHWGLPMPSAEVAKKFIELGARFLPHHSDILLIKEGLERIQREFGAEGFTFANQFTS